MLAHSITVLPGKIPTRLRPHSFPACLSGPAAQQQRPPTGSPYLSVKTFQQPPPPTICPAHTPNPPALDPFGHCQPHALHITISRPRASAGHTRPWSHARYHAPTDRPLRPSHRNLHNAHRSQTADRKPSTPCCLATRSTASCSRSDGPRPTCVSPPSISSRAFHVPRTGDFHRSGPRNFTNLPRRNRNTLERRARRILQSRTGMTWTAPFLKERSYDHGQGREAETPG